MDLLLEYFVTPQRTSPLGYNIYKPIADTSCPIGVGRIFTRLEKLALKLLLLLHMPHRRRKAPDQLENCTGGNESRETIWKPRG